MTPFISVVIPTVARPTLRRLLDSIPDEPDVEVLLVGDSYGGDYVAEIKRAEAELHGPNRRWLLCNGGIHAWGHPQRNYGDRMATGDWLIHSQDDNEYLLGAFDVIRQAIAEQEGSPHPLLFQVNTWQAGIVWARRELAEHNLDADCIVAPRDPNRLGTWTNIYNGDWDFVRETAAFYGNRVDFRDELIARSRPEVFHSL